MNPTYQKPFLAPRERVKHLFNAIKISGGNKYNFPFLFFILVAMVISTPNEFKLFNFDIAICLS